MLSLIIVPLISPASMSDKSNALRTAGSFRLRKEVII